MEYTINKESAIRLIKIQLPVLSQSSFVQVLVASVKMTFNVKKEAIIFSPEWLLYFIAFGPSECALSLAVSLDLALNNWPASITRRAMKWWNTSANPKAMLAALLLPSMTF